MMHSWYGQAGNYMLQGNYWWMGLSLIVFRVIVLVVLIYLAVKLFKRYENRSTVSKNPDDSAMNILRERYARGEIDTEEFVKRKSDLE